MTELARELLDDVNLNDYVKVRYGTDQNQDSAEGTVTKVTDNFLTLTRTDGSRLKIRVDDLRSLDMPTSTQTFAPPQQFNTPPQTFQPQAVRPFVDSGISIARKTVDLEPAAPYNFVAREWLEKIRDLKQNIFDQKLKRDVNNILASMKTAVKNRDVAYKYHDLRAKILGIWDDCDVEADYEIFYLMLGVLAVTAKEYANSYEPLIRAREYSLAGFAATAAARHDFAEIFVFCALLSGQEKTISRQVALVCAEKHDVVLLDEILESNRDDETFCEQVAACAKLMLDVARVDVKLNVEENLSAYEAAKKLLDAYPENLKRDSGILNYWHEYQSYTFPEPKVVAETPDYESSRLTGRIYNYNVQGGWGFITPEYFFHVGQIYDYTESGLLLRKMLFLNLWEQLEVSFSLGESLKYPGRTAASGVELTEKGYDEAQQLLQNGKPAPVKHTGVVEAFFPVYMNGRVVSNTDGNTYLFKLDDIADPWLKAFFRNLNDRNIENQEVSFEASGKKALNLCWNNPTQFYRDNCEEFVTEEDRTQWEKFLAAKETEGQKPELPAEDPYKAYRYVALPEVKSASVNEKSAPLAWRKDLPCE